MALDLFMLKWHIYLVLTQGFLLSPTKVYTRKLSLKNQKENHDFLHKIPYSLK